MQTELDWLQNYFKDKKDGRLLEIGVYDCSRHSLSAPFISLGWSAVLVEPNAYNFTRALAAYRDNPKVKLLNAAMSNRDGISEFWHQVDGGEVSSVSTEHMIQFSTGEWKNKFQKSLVATISPRTLMTHFDNGCLGWDLVIIDAEDHSVPILKAFPFTDMLDNSVICVEQDRSGMAALAAAIPRNYTIALSSFPNIIATRNKPGAV